jgi:hypothetical protein
MKKNFVFVLFVSFIFSSFLVFTSCEKETSITPSENPSSFDRKNVKTVSLAELNSKLADDTINSSSLLSDEPAPGCELFSVTKGLFGQLTVTFVANYQGYGTNGSIKHSWSAKITTPLCGTWDAKPSNNNLTYYQVTIPGDCVTGGGGKPLPITIEVTHCIFGDSQTGWQCETQTFVIQ